MKPGWEIWRDVWLEKNYWPPAGVSERNFGFKVLERPPVREIRKIFVGKHESEALGEIDGDVVGQSGGGCLSVKRTGPGLVNIWNGCQVGSLDGQLRRCAETKAVCSYALRRPCKRMRSYVGCRP